MNHPLTDKLLNNFIVGTDKFKEGLDTIITSFLQQYDEELLKKYVGGSIWWGIEKRREQAGILAKQINMLDKFKMNPNRIIDIVYTAFGLEPEKQYPPYPDEVSIKIKDPETQSQEYPNDQRITYLVRQVRLINSRLNEWETGYETKP